MNDDHMIIDEETKDNIVYSNYLESCFSQVRFPRMSQAEARIKNDLVEFENKRMKTDRFEVILSDVYRDENNMTFEMIVEFRDYFKIKIIFKENYPFTHPDIVYYSGSHMDMDIFNFEGNIKLHYLTKKDWSPVLSINSILFSIELLILKKGKVNGYSLMECNNHLPSHYDSFQMSETEIDTDMKIQKDDIPQRKKKKKKYSQFKEEYKKYFDETVNVSNDELHIGLIEKLQRIQLQSLN